jgi:hypothetical protein
MPKWLPGQSGNVHGRPKRKTVEDEVKFRLERFRGRDRKEITAALIDCAKQKRPWALKLVVDIDLLRVRAGPTPTQSTPAEELSTDERLARLEALLTNSDVRESLQALIGKLQAGEMVQ